MNVLFLINYKVLQTNIYNYRTNWMHIDFKQGNIMLIPTIQFNKYTLPSITTNIVWTRIYILVLNIIN